MEEDFQASRQGPKDLSSAGLEVNTRFCDVPVPGKSRGRNTNAIADSSVTASICTCAPAAIPSPTAVQAHTSKHLIIDNSSRRQPWKKLPYGSRERCLILDSLTAAVAKRLVAAQTAGPAGSLKQRAPGSSEKKEGFPFEGKGTHQKGRSLSFCLCMKSKRASPSEGPHRSDFPYVSMCLAKRSMNRPAHGQTKS